MRRSRFDGVAVGHGPELVHARQVRTGNLQAPVSTPGRDQQLRVRDVFARIEMDTPAGRIDAHDRVSDQLDVVLLVPGARPDQPSGQVLLPAEVGLGQRRAAKWEAWLGPDQHDAPVVTLFAQRLGGDTTGHPRTGDDDRRARAGLSQGDRFQAGVGMPGTS